MNQIFVVVTPVYSHYLGRNDANIFGIRILKIVLICFFLVLNATLTVRFGITATRSKPGNRRKRLWPDGYRGTRTAKNV